MGLKTFIGFIVIAAFVIIVLCIGTVCNWIKSIVIKTRFGEWYNNNVKSNVDNIGMVVSILIFISAVIIASWQVGEWITGW